MSVSTCSLLLTKKGRDLLTAFLIHFLVTKKGRETPEEVFTALISSCHFISGGYTPFPMVRFHHQLRFIWSVWSVWSIWFIWSVWSVWSDNLTLHYSGRVYSSFKSNGQQKNDSIDRNTQKNRDTPLFLCRRFLFPYLYYSLTNQKQESVPVVPAGAGDRQERWPSWPHRLG